MSSTRLPFGITAIRHDFAIPLGPDKKLPRWVHSFVLEREAPIAVDAGVSGSGPDIVNAAGGNVSLLLLTHAHPDHLGGAKSLCERCGCVLAGPAAERSWIETPEVQLEQRPVPGFWQLVEGGVRIERELRDGERVSAAPELEVVATPGHSPGHVAFWDSERRVLFAGDAIPVAGEMPIYDDAAASARSLQRLQALAPVALLLSAWDEPREGEAAMQAIEHGLEVLRTMQRSVDEVRAKLGAAADLMTATGEVADRLGLPPHLAGPMLARTVKAHLERPIRYAK